MREQCLKPRAYAKLESIYNSQIVSACIESGFYREYLYLGHKHWKLKDKSSMQALMTFVGLPREGALALSASW